MLRKIPEYGDVMTVDEFLEDCMAVRFINWDGSGYYSDGKTYDWDKSAYPSDFVKGKIDRNFNYVVWFNK